MSASVKKLTQDWQKLRGFAYLAKVIEGVKFINSDHYFEPLQRGHGLVGADLV